MAKEELGVTTTLGGVVGAPATYDDTGFAALTYETIGDITSIGTLGGTGQVTEFINLATGLVEKFVGSINYGSCAVSFGKDFLDAGQAFIASAFDGADSRKTCSFVLTTPSGYKLYFTSKVTSDSYDGFEANTVVMGSTTLEINNKILAVAP